MNHCFLKKLINGLMKDLKYIYIYILSNEENSGSISCKPNDIGDILRIENTNEYVLRKKSTIGSTEFFTKIRMFKKSSSSI